jgi:predicted metalloprotease with PDZ domain
VSARFTRTWFVAVVFCHCAFAQSAIRYFIALSNPERHLVRVTMEIPPGQDTHELQLPVWNALYQVRDFSQYLNWIRVEDLSGRALVMTELTSSRWRVAGAGKGARVQYQIFADSPDPYGAQLNARHAFFNLAEILLYAEDARNSATQVEFRDVPPQWKIATPLPQNSGALIAANYDQLVDSPVEIGTFEEKDFSTSCGTYRLILDRDGDSLSKSQAQAISEKILPLVERIVSTATNWMDDCPFQSYMFIFHTSDSPGGGMEHAYGTAITLPEKDFTDRLDLFASITSHEFFHLWNVKRIQPQSLQPIDYTKENYTPSLWFSEGVDSTVGEYLLLRAGLLDERHYLEHLSQEITELENRPAHLTQSAEESSRDAWLEKYPYYGLPERSISYYNKGELLGVLLDLIMRDSSNDKTSLRELFRWMNQRYAKPGKSFADSAAVRQAAETVSHGDLGEFFQKCVSGTEEIPWDKFFARVGLQVIQAEVTFAEPGFDAVQKFDQPPTVVHVLPGSAAEGAGLKEDDIILQIQGQPAGRNFEREIMDLAPGAALQLVVSRGGIRHELQWTMGSRKQAVFHLQDVSAMSPQQKAHRAAWLFGDAASSSAP